MEKVLISLYSKRGDKLLNAIGIVDTESKVLWIPKYSKEKEFCFVDSVACDNIVLGNNGSYIATSYRETDDGKHYMNVYYLKPVKEKVTE